MKDQFLYCPHCKRVRKENEEGSVSAESFSTAFINSLPAIFCDLCLSTDKVTPSEIIEFLLNRSY